MEFRKINEGCPLKDCKGDLYVVEYKKGEILAYNCLKCRASFEAIIHHDFENKQYYWIGVHRNPAFWTFNNEDLVEGMRISEEKEKAGIPQYLGKYVVERISY